jgi:hypothetical protein
MREETHKDINLNKLLHATGVGRWGVEMLPTTPEGASKELGESLLSALLPL